MKTVGIAVSAGYDCDNQAATCAGLIGVLHGSKCIPKEMTEEFNDQYVCFTRDDVPIATPLSNIVERIGAIAKTAILENGGRMEFRTDKVPPLKGQTLTTELKGSTITIAFGEGRAATVSGGEYGEGTDADYLYKDQSLWINIGESTWIQGFYDGERLEFRKGEVQGEVTYIINSDF